MEGRVEGRRCPSRAPAAGRPRVFSRAHHPNHCPGPGADVLCLRPEILRQRCRDPACPDRDERQWEREWEREWEWERKWSEKEERERSWPWLDEENERKRQWPEEAGHARRRDEWRGSRFSPRKLICQADPAGDGTWPQRRRERPQRRPHS